MPSLALISVRGLLPLLILSFCTPSALADDEDRLGFLAQAMASVPAGKRGATLAPYFFVRGTDPEADSLPLKSVHAQVQIVGVIAEVELTQVYKNEGQSTLEAIYIFPASTGAAVNAMKMWVGEREIEARIEKREDARKSYEQARASGKTASLLEQQRPNVFQMNVANILPGDEIRVRLAYNELLVPEENQYEFVLPAVVGPRYSNLEANNAAKADKWVANPYLHEGEDPPYSWGLDLVLSSGIPINRMTSPTHGVQIEFTGPRHGCLSIQDDPSAGNRDFVLRYQLAGDQIEHGLMLYEGEQENFFLMMVEPPERIEKTDLVNREYIFILDVSGSMGGFPLDTAKELMRDLLLDLRSYDHFNILTFAGGSQLMAPVSLPATRSNVRKAAEWIDRLIGSGGTELLPAMKRALSMPARGESTRTLVVVTDGYVHIEKEVFGLIRDNLGRANLFAFGIGTSVNRWLIEGMARAGLGEPFVVTAPGEASDKAERFRKYISAPLMKDIAVQFDGFEAYDVEPMIVPDLFASRPIVIMGKYRGEPKGVIVVKGGGPDGPLDADVRVGDSEPSPDHRALRSLWARRRVQNLVDLDKLDPDGMEKKELTSLGLRYGLLTAYTSFVAVDSEIRADGKRITQVRQPLPLPQGVSNQAVGQLGLLGALGTSGSGSGGGGVAKGYGGLGSATASGHSRAAFRMGSVSVSGSLDSSAIQRVVRKHRRSLQSIYERQLKKNPALNGKVVVRIEIGADGKVTKAEVSSSTVADEEFEAALLKQIRRWRFPKPAGGGKLVVSYPFIFRSVP